MESKVICNALCRKVGFVEMKEGIELCQKYDGTSMKARLSQGDIGITDATLGLKPEKKPIYIQGGILKGINMGHFWLLNGRPGFGAKLFWC